MPYKLVNEIKIKTMHVTSNYGTRNDTGILITYNKKQCAFTVPTKIWGSDEYEIWDNIVRSTCYALFKDVVKGAMIKKRLLESLKDGG